MFGCVDELASSKNMDSLPNIYIAVGLLLMSAISSVLSSEVVKVGPLLRAESEGTDAAICVTLCRELKEKKGASVACKDFTHVLPHPKIRRTCTNKFEEGHALACSFVCSR